MEDIIFCAAADVDKKIIFLTNQKLHYLEFTAPGINSKTSQTLYSSLISNILFFLSKDSDCESSTLTI